MPTEYLASEARGASELEMVFDDEMSSIDNSQLTIDNEAGAVYDLQGRRINNGQLKPGLYIVNGRKVVIK